MRHPEVRTQRAEQPLRWDDHQGWDAYYQVSEPWQWESASASHYIESFPKWVQRLRSRGWLKLWFPGCGASALPVLFAAFGFRVWASDVSEAALRVHERDDFQLKVQRLLKSIRQDHGSEAVQEAIGELHLIHHDFRVAFAECDFDCVFNVQALQGLPAVSRARAATVHWGALRSTGHAFFDLHHADFATAEAITAELEEAGFVVVGHDLDRWYRTAVSKLGLDFFNPWYPFFELLLRRLRLGRFRTWRLKRRYACYVGEYRRRYRPIDDFLDAQAATCKRIAHIVHHFG